jgi:hypothetical protein
MACMMMASRRASAIRAFRRLDRLAIANAQSFTSAVLVARQHHVRSIVHHPAGIARTARFTFKAPF